MWLNEGSCLRLQSCWLNRIWSYSLLVEGPRDGPPLRILTLVDEHTGDRVAIDAEWRVDSMSVLERLVELFIRQGAPHYLSSDNVLT